VAVYDASLSTKGGGDSAPDPAHDASLGTALVTLSELRHDDSHEYHTKVKATAISGQLVAKGTLIFTATWIPHASEYAAHAPPSSPHHAASLQPSSCCVTHKCMYRYAGIHVHMRIYTAALRTSHAPSPCPLTRPPPILVGSADAVPCGLAAGETRIVVGTKPLVLRASMDLNSLERRRLPEGARVRLLDARETADGVRARVQLLELPNEGAKARDVSAETVDEAAEKAREARRAKDQRVEQQVKAAKAAKVKRAAKDKSRRAAKAAKVAKAAKAARAAKLGKRTANKEKAAHEKAALMLQAAWRGRLARRLRVAARAQAGLASYIVLAQPRMAVHKEPSTDSAFEDGKWLAHGSTVTGKLVDRGRWLELVDGTGFAEVEHPGLGKMIQRAEAFDEPTDVGPLAAMPTPEESPPPLSDTTRGDGGENSGDASGDGDSGAVGDGSNDGDADGDGDGDDDGGDAVTGVTGWVTALKSGGLPRLAVEHTNLDAMERRLQMELWERRLIADRALASPRRDKKREKPAGASPTVRRTHHNKHPRTTDAKLFHTGPSFAHEFDKCKRRIAFACACAPFDPSCAILFIALAQSYQNMRSSTLRVRRRRVVSGHSACARRAHQDTYSALLSRRKWRLLVARGVASASDGITGVALSCRCQTRPCTCALYAATTEELAAALRGGRDGLADRAPCRQHGQHMH
jgi:flagellar biosynthesis GTPase FlhF